MLADPAALRRWLVVIALALLTAATTGRVVGAAEDARHRWGETRAVLVASRAVAGGASLAGATTAARWPIALIPDGALDDPNDLPPHARAAGPIAVGRPLSSVDVAPPADDPERGWRVALLPGTAPLPVEPGDRVDVWATTDPSLAGGRPATRRLARGATVVSADEAAVVVAVAEDEVADLAEATSLSTVTVVAVP